MISPSEIKCTNCGAIVQEKICEHCGTPLIKIRNMEEEKQALEDYHQRLSERSEQEQVRWLRNGFIPADPETLSEAGIRCLPLIDESRLSDVGDAAVSRLEAIITGLRLASIDEHTQQLIWDFQSRIAKYRSARQSMDKWILVAAVAIVLCAIAGVVWLIMR